MAKKKTELAPVTQTKALTNWRDRMAKSVERERKMTEQLPADGGNFISFGGGTITVGGIEINPLKGIALAQQSERAYYSGAYSPTSKELPSCFSLDMVQPHGNSSDPQSEKCAQCPQNQFGSADQGGGKACKEGVKLALVPHDGVDGPIYVTKKISWSSTKVWRNVAGALDGAIATYAMKMANKPDARTQYKLTFDMQPLPVNDNQLMERIASRLDEAEALVALPYPATEEEAPKAAPSGRKRKF
jgi:hypothetical protein